MVGDWNFWIAKLLEIKTFWSPYAWWLNFFGGFRYGNQQWVSITNWEGLIVRWWLKLFSAATWLVTKNFWWQKNCLSPILWWLNLFLVAICKGVRLGVRKNFLAFILTECMQLSRTCHVGFDNLPWAELGLPHLDVKWAMMRRCAFHILLLVSMKPTHPILS